MSVTPGVRLGPYEILAAIGSGGMGEVYRARDTRLGRMVAVKVLHGREGSGGAPMIEREARAVAALNHPNICTLYDVGHDGQVGYLVMEYLEGRTMEDALRSGPLPPESALSCAKQLGAALAAAHAQGVVHRDLKPANLFLTTSGVLKVLDFGIAKSMGPGDADAVTVRRTTQTGTFLGTVGYCAPEQLRGELVDDRSDLFAAGAVLSEIVTGRPPFARRSAVDTMSAILHEEPPALPSTAPPALAAAIARCLAKHPASRFQSARELLDAIDAPAPASLVFTPSVPDGPPSIAVLPFADLSPDKDQEYFCDGMADELISALMGLEGMRVASRTSAFQFKGRAEDVGEIGRRLKVKNVLEGSVRRAGNRLRVTVQLTDVAEGFQLWSERFDRALDDVFAVQDEIAHNVVEKLKVEMSGRTGGRLVPQGMRNVEAYNLYLQGRYSVRKLTKEGFENGMASFQKALALEPEYAEAHAALAQGFMLLAIFSVAAPRHVMPMAIDAVTKALAINPNLAEGQLGLAWAKHWYDWDWDGADRAYRRAIELAPGDSWPRMCYGVFLGLRGRHDAAVSEARRATDLDPVSVIISRGLTDALCLAHRFDEAIENASRAIALEPAFSSTYWALGLAQAGKGQYRDAVETLEKGRAFAYGDATLDGFLGWAYGMAGEREKAHAVAGQLEARREGAYVNATCIGLAHQGVGDMDTAMRWYRQAYDDRATDCCSYALAPHFETAREDARFRALVARIEAGGAESKP